MGQTMLVLVAHPDDETFGTGSVIANAAAAGLRVVVCCATRGEAGEDTSGTTNGTDELAAAREAELRAAAKVLGAADVIVLDFADSGLSGDMPTRAFAAVDIEEATAAFAEVIAQVDPDIVIAFDSASVNDHRDHQRAGEAATLAFARAAKPSARLYHWTLARSIMDRWLAEMKAQGVLDEYTGLELGLPDAQITTVVDVTHVMDRRRTAIAEHKTQFSPFSGLSPELEHEILAHDHFVRVVPPWDGGPIERSIFG